MMSLLSVTVKKAHYVGAQAAAQFNSYVTLKLQNVKSTTVTVKGASPCWEQDFLFETNDLNTGLLIEVWSKGMIWDRAMGYHWLPLQGVQYSNEEGSGQWLSLDAELVMRDGEVVGTKNPTGNSLLVDCRFELPFDPENIEASDLQRKLEMLNNIMDQEARAEQARRQMQYFGHSGYSEDSDYTSDLNYPVGQHANSSASQFRSAVHQLHTPQRSLETSRENSYERDDQHHHLSTSHNTHQHHLSPGSHRSRHLQQRYSPNADDYGYGSTNVGQNTRQYQDNNVDSEPLFYNSRPRNKTEYSSQEWGSYDSYHSAQQSIDGVDLGYSDYIDQPSRKPKASRRPSLERQTTLYDDPAYFTDNIYGSQVTQVSHMHTNQQKMVNKNCEPFFNSSSYNFQDERYGQDEEDRQWDSGGTQNNRQTGRGKKLPTIPIKRRSSMTVQDEETYSCAPTRRRMPQIPTKRSSSRQSSLNDETYDGYRTPDQSHRGASLPPTPTKTTKLIGRFSTSNKPFNSLPPTPGRQLPKPNLNHRSAKVKRNNLMKRTSSAEYTDNYDDSYYMRPGAISARATYNEDYNYAYQSIDNLPNEEQISEMTPVQSDNRTSANVNNTINNSTTQAQINNDYYYNTQDNVAYSQENQINYFQKDDNVGQTNYYNDTNNSYMNGHNAYNEEITQNEHIQNNSKKMLGRHINSPLLKQNTDSLESRDDELKDSFDTAISSINSSLQFNKNYSEYSTAGEMTPTITSYPDSVAKVTTTTVQYNRDQTDLPKAIVTTNGVISYPPQTTITTNTTTKVSSNRGYLQPQESINGSYNDYNEHYYETDETLESYQEEEVSTNGISGKAINNRESPASVIHVENYDDDQSLRRGSSQITVVDPYQRNAVETYPGSRRASLEPNRHKSGDPYLNSQNDPYLNTPSDPYLNSQNDPYLNSQPLNDPYSQTINEPYPPQNTEEFIPSPPRKLSAADSYQQTRRASARQSPELERQETTEVISPTEEAPEKKSVSFEEEEEQKPARPQVTAQQRWHWAYNKIIMQLNVSFFYFL